MIFFKKKIQLTIVYQWNLIQAWLITRTGVWTQPRELYLVLHVKVFDTYSNRITFVVSWPLKINEIEKLA